MKHLLRHCLLLPLALFTLAPVPGFAQSAPDYTGIDHVEFSVTSLERALDFYTKLFGAELWKDRQSARRYLRVGEAYLAMEQQGDPGIAHMCFGVDGFNIDSVHRWLTAQSIPWQDSPAGTDLHVDDRDGIRTRLAQNISWEGLVSTRASRETREVEGAPIFTAYTLDEVFLTVTNLEVDSLFYSRLLDQSGTLQAGSLWFQVGAARLRVTQAPVGQKPGLAYFAVHVAYTDMEAAADAVFAAGGIIENILPNGFSFWDPDGIRVVVRSGDLY